MSPDSNYQQKIDSLENEVARLKDLLFVLVRCVEYRDDKPYDALTSQLMTFGDERIKLFFILECICDAMDGKPPSLKSHLLRGKIDVDKIFKSNPLKKSGAIDILSKIVGTANAEEILEAFRKQYKDS